MLVFFFFYKDNVYEFPQQRFPLQCLHPRLFVASLLYWQRTRLVKLMATQIKGAVRTSYTS